MNGGERINGGDRNALRKLARNRVMARRLTVARFGSTPQTPIGSWVQRSRKARSAMLTAILIVALAIVLAYVNWVANSVNCFRRVNHITSHIYEIGNARSHHALR
jgi:hypothetical protein